MVADDQPTNRELLEYLLITQGFKVITVPDRAAALEQANTVQSELALLEVMMSRMDGFTVCADIKANPETCQIPVILITALSDKQDRIEGIKAGADGFSSQGR